MSELIRNPVIDSILSRRSIRDYKPDLISRDQLDTILECGLWAPSGKNTQSAVLVPTQNIDCFQQINDEVRQLLGISEPDWKFAHGAHTLIFIYDNPGDRWFGVNAALCAENMSLAAESMGLGSAIIGMIREYMRSAAGREWQKRFGVPDDYDFICALALGYASEEGRKLPRQENRVLYY